MKFVDLHHLINSDTDIDVVRGCCKLKTIKRGTYYEDIPYEIKQAEVKGITAVDCRIIEIHIGGKGK